MPRRAIGQAALPDCPKNSSGTSFRANPEGVKPMDGLSNIRNPGEKCGLNPMHAAYAELHCLSNFTFLRGASHPQELVERATQLGYQALAITDECSLAGVVRAHTAAKDHHLKLIIGSEIRLDDGPRLVLLATDGSGYGNLSALITHGRRHADKGSYHLTRQDLATGLPGCLALLIPQKDTNPEQARWVADTFPGRAWLAVELHRGSDDQAWLNHLRTLGRQAQLPLLASGDVHMHRHGRRAVQDLLTAIRLGTPLKDAGYALFPNGERHLRPIEHLVRLYPQELLAETLNIAARCHFTLDELRYNHPDDMIPADRQPAEYLRQLTEQGIHKHWPQGAPAKVRKLVEHELAIIAELQYEPYFLLVHDIVRFARDRGILCQGRGSAANSAVCYCLGITAVDPSRMEMLFERFVSKERNEPPDIDVDFEHERREEVIQYLYRKYGRERAALAATLITYRPKSAIRDVGKALGLEAAQLDRLVNAFAWWDRRSARHQRLREAGFDPDNPMIKRLFTLVDEILGFPRHLSQHVGGFVITREPLSRLVPIENATMAERTVIQWDKDDLDAMGLLKVDCLALGMLSAIRRAFDLLENHRGVRLTLDTLPAEDPAVYHIIQKADTIGLFQIESRAQMSMLPRLKPKTFYDLVIEIAIVRPGPIQGKMVHPYLRRRQGLEPVSYPGAGVQEVLERTLGIPIFQEQVIKLAMVAAGFSAGEADQLRRAMGAWRRHGQLEHFEQRLIEGMRQRGYGEEFARQIFAQIRGFGEYGFPESHSASFALLAYTSAWLKCYEPAAFTCALLNSQPMGFYAPTQLIQDARRHGVEVKAADVVHSEWDCTLESASPDSEEQPALRLGLRMIKGLSREGAARLVTVRRQKPLSDTPDLARRAHLAHRDLEALASAGALAPLAGHRHQAHWQILGVEKPMPLFEGAAPDEAQPLLPIPSEAQNLLADYASVGLTLGRHPLALLRRQLNRLRYRPMAQVHARPNGSFVRTAGLVISRQRPGSASGVIFLTLEDETGNSNIVVWEKQVERYRKEILGARLLGVSGTLQREGEVIHIVAGKLEDHSALLGGLETSSRDFC